jgi:dethiobiotin synthetase
MKTRSVFITGTDTDVGKTFVSKWLCYHFNLKYFKPIQTGILEIKDKDTIEAFCQTKPHESIFEFMHPLSPDQAALLENKVIDQTLIRLPQTSDLLVEGAGGLFVPVNDKVFMIDLIKELNLPVILVTRSTLGTINHTLLSLEALKQRDIKVLGVIMNGPLNELNKQSIQRFTHVPILHELPLLDDDTLKKHAPSPSLQKVFDHE